MPAQQPAVQKKAPNQVAGAEEPDRPLTADELLAIERQFGKNPEGVTLTVLPNGLVRAELDESFMDALTVSIDDAGSLKFGHEKGLRTAKTAAQVKAAKKQANGSATKASKTQTKTAALEEKE